MGIKFVDFSTDKSLVASVIYGRNEHRTTNKGVVISDEIKRELKRFLTGFNTAVGVEQTPYYRIDAYFDEQTLWILEINAAFVDGWGTALNLARASGIAVDRDKLEFPRRFAVKNRIYLPELELFVSELSALGLNSRHICELGDNSTELIYVYGRAGSKGQSHILPYDGARLDNKLNLGLFSREWKSDLIKIPRHYINRFDAWGEIPQEVVLKFCDKESVECRRAGQSVMFGKPSGKAPFISRCYRAETLLGQERIFPASQDRANCQLIIFAIGNEPITGYVQYDWRRIINDDSIHGPLQIG